MRQQNFMFMGAKRIYFSILENILKILLQKKESKLLLNHPQAFSIEIVELLPA